MERWNYVIRNAKLTGARSVDIAIKDDRIADIADNIAETGIEEIDAHGQLVTVPLVDAHIHLDATLTVPERTTNHSGTLLEGIQRWSEIKPDLTVEDVKTRAREAILWEVAHGTLQIRSHVDICDEKLTALHALRELKDEMAELVDLQLVAFPQEGVLCYPHGQELMETALHEGADIVGGIPHYEWTREDGIRELEYVFELAHREGRMIDVHCDETDDPESRFVETMARLTKVYEWEGRVSASHTTAMHSYNPAYGFKLRRILRQSDMAIIANPLTNVVLQGRFDDFPKRRGMAPIKELDAYGIPVALGFDCIMDPWYPLGTGNLLQAAWMALHLGHMTGAQERERVFRMATVNGQSVFYPGQPNDLVAGRPADLVIWDAPSAIEALRLLPVAQTVMRHGHIVAQAEPSRHQVYYQGQNLTVNFRPRTAR
ncbi:MAG TPA: cytosine deaminase [Sulfobacillus sp.]|nr:cytosine deaminase [Sulfobacillus sp.]